METTISVNANEPETQIGKPCNTRNSPRVNDQSDGSMTPVFFPHTNSPTSSNPSTIAGHCKTVCATVAKTG